MSDDEEHFDKVFPFGEGKLELEGIWGGDARLEKLELEGIWGGDARLETVFGEMQTNIAQFRTSSHLDMGSRISKGDAPLSSGSTLAAPPMKEQLQVRC